MVWSAGHEIGENGKAFGVREGRGESRREGVTAGGGVTSGS
jgi:hypothetical protein